MANEITTPMEPSGRVLPLFRGDYLDSVVYENPDIVLYKNSSYVAKQTTVGNLPPDNAASNDYWQMIAKGIVDADMSDATVEFTQAEKRVNIESGEDGKTLFGKIKKWFADLKPVAFSGKLSDLIDAPRVVSKSSDGFAPQLPNETTTDKYLRQDGTWAIPPDTNTHAVSSVNNKTGAVTLSAADIEAVPASDKITKLNNISQITGIGFWAIAEIDNTYAASIGIDNNVGDFYAMVLSYNGNSTKFNFGTVILSSPRLAAYHYMIQVWEGVAFAQRVLNYSDVTRSAAVTVEGKKALDAVEKNAAIAGTLANQLQQVNSNLGTHLKWLGIPPENSANNAIGMGIYGTNPYSEITNNWGVLIVFTNGDDNYNRWVFQFWLSTSGNMYQRRKINDDPWTELTLLPINNT